MADTRSRAPMLTIARFVVEATSPISIASGGDDPVRDTPLVRDPNGLPMLPATSIAGVLKHVLDPETAKTLLGFQATDEGARSAVSISDGLIHWSNDMPRDGLLLGENVIKSDPLARWFADASPLQREHVRISEAGVVDGEGKFDRSACPAGSRFTFEMSIRHGAEEDPLTPLVTALHSGVSMGGATRSGYGKLICIREAIERIDLRKNREGYLALLGTGALDQKVEFSDVSPAKSNTTMKLRLKSEGPLLIGGSSSDANIDSAPYAEAYIDWSSDEGTRQTRYVIPGSSIKGPLRHRTAYYLAKGRHDLALANAVFGTARDGDAGNAGILFFGDAYFDGSHDSANGHLLIDVAHVGIDRFTAGARKGVLFVNQMLWQPEFLVNIDGYGLVSGEAKAALDAALGDLLSGHLGIGADWGDGVGVVSGEEVRDAA